MRAISAGSGRAAVKVRSRIAPSIAHAFHRQFERELLLSDVHRHVTDAAVRKYPPAVQDAWEAPALLCIFTPARDWDGDIQLGPVGSAESSGPLPGNQFPDTEVFVANQRVQVHYAGRSGCCAALDQIVFQVPYGVDGCFVPVVVRSGTAVSNFVSMPVSLPGQSCLEPVGLAPNVLGMAASNREINVAALALGPSRHLYPLSRCAVLCHPRRRGRTAQPRRQSAPSHPSAAAPRPYGLSQRVVGRADG